MNESEFHVQSFIIKFWIENSGANRSNTAWHGTITHVPSGANRSVKNLYEVIDFIRPYLEERGVTKGLGKRKSFLCRWIKKG
jgi:hypothetical protein